MLRFIAFLILFCSQFFSGSAQFFLTHINIVDVEKGQISKDQTVAITGNRISAISSNVPTHDQGRVYDCSGKYLIPGLWDMHIHDGGDQDTRFEYLPLFIANGITGVRDMWGSPEMLALKNDIDEGRFTGPRMVVGSPIIEGGVPFFTRSMKAPTSEAGRRLVDSFSNAGYDFIKIYSTVKEPVYLAIADECKKRGIALEGHLPVTVGLEEALDAGQRSFEHDFGLNRLLLGKEREELDWARHYLDTAKSVKSGEYMIHGEPAHMSPSECHISYSILQKMFRSRAAIVPTLTLFQGRSASGEFMASHTMGLQYLTNEFVNFWKNTPSAFPPEYVQNIEVSAKFFFDKGVMELAGTDVNNPFCVPGFGLQQELMNLHHAGLSNLQVLQTATINPAKFLYRENDLGTISLGKLADLVVLDDNPLTEIAHCQLINAVVLNGKYISKEDIHKILADQKSRQHPSR
ncbi:MAG TPA: amidohydrolase family protein [Puia sp.]|nr:amidohydrolase family protein [Puia sp.]